MSIHGRSAIVVSTTIIAAFIGLCTGFFFFQDRADTRMLNLLRGSSEHEIGALTITGQRQNQLDIRDPESLGYLTNAFRTATNEGYVPLNHKFNYMYTAHVKLGTMLSASFEVSCHEDENGLLIRNSEGLDDPIFYWVQFPEPIPESILKMMLHLRGKTSPNGIESKKSTSPPTTSKR